VHDEGFERTIGLRSAVAINMTQMAVFVIIQGIAQVVALTVLRRVRPDLERPYKMWLYPLPSLIALVGWGYIYISSGHTPIIFSIVVIVAGVLSRQAAGASAPGTRPP
jgi:hypothetical protein